MTRQPHKPVFNESPSRRVQKDPSLQRYVEARLQTRLNPSAGLKIRRYMPRRGGASAPPGYPLSCQESEGRGGGESGVGRTSGADCARSGDERAMRSGRPTEMPIGTTAISVVISVSGSDEQLHAS